MVTQDPGSPLRWDSELRIIKTADGTIHADSNPALVTYPKQDPVCFTIKGPNIPNSSQTHTVKLEQG